MVNLSFTKENCQNDINNGMSLEQIYKKYNKNRGTGKYWIKKWGLKSNFKSFENGYNGDKTDDPESGFQLCNLCNENKSLNEYSYRKDRKVHHRTCKKCHTEHIRVCRLKFKRDLKTLIYSKIGNTCGICGIQGHYTMMEVHHVDMSKKEMSIANIKTLAELDKLNYELKNCECILLCACCHSETHGGIHPHLIKNPPSKNIPDEVLLNEHSKKCEYCNKIYPNEYYHSGNKCKKCHNEYARNNCREIKKQCVQYLSPIDNSCMKCGYNRYIGALDFHHRDPTQKEFGIARNHSQFGEKHKRELDKCNLLCKNCHRLEHYYLDNPKERPESSLDNDMSDLNIGTDFGVEESKEEN